ncbi:Flp pilus assembly protein TadB [Kribbella aluminosa]|uniref:Flp pilus assembly protein TadB n=1 Tax=Kribbella aluminosa TaxID=416017 RepID=A0ABS4US00_9ACTN|nr:type II secretion system F family protein [Kribbella aluminosa]MBP2354400.1 Flp pilus assembly protein TadB [Kribbella aluminosa]
MPQALAAAVTVALSTYLFIPPRPDLRRLTRPRRRTTPRPPRTHRLAATAAALAALTLLDFPWSLIPAAIAYYAIPKALSRLEPAATKQRNLQISRDLPLAIDLLTASLRAGRPPQQALSLVAEALPGPLADIFTKIAHHLALGADPTTAWSHLSSEPSCAPMARAISRSVRSGAALSKTLEHLADETRRTNHHAADQHARSAESRATLPLGLCFLPAFVLLSIVPTIADALIPYLLHP